MNVIKSTILWKGKIMPKKPVFKEYPDYLVIFRHNGATYIEEYTGARPAVNAYRQFRDKYGDNCRLAKVVLNYGEEV